MLLIDIVTVTKYIKWNNLNFNWKHQLMIEKSYVNFVEVFFYYVFLLWTFTVCMYIKSLNIKYDQNSRLKSINAMTRTWACLEGRLKTSFSSAFFVFIFLCLCNKTFEGSGQMSKLWIWKWICIVLLLLFI